MNILILKLLLGGIFHKKLRLILSILGIIIGVSALFVMNTFGEAAKIKTLQEIETFGPEILIVVSGQARVRAGRALQAEQTTTLKLEDAQALRKLSAIRFISPLYTGSAIIRYHGRNLSTVVQGVNEDYLKIRKFSLYSGRNLLKEEIMGFKKVVILGHKVKRELFGDEVADGKVIHVNKLPFTVVGVLSPVGVDASNQDQDDQILIPISTAMSALFNVDYLSAIYLSVASPTLVPLVEKQVDEILLRRHKISPKDRDFNLIKAEDILKFKTEASTLFSSLVQSISILCLLVGSLGVTAIMLLSVNERRKEIGLRLALGAEKKMILKQFLIESVCISFLGGLIGFLLGFLAILIFLPLLKYPLVLPLKTILVSTGLTVLFGLLSGIYPAYKASKIDPAILLKGL
ncbi:MAG: ABC transporter permease [Caldimicrobium sp.]|nr:ABC transporter permease [Caldimicrobium sp.]MDW8182831.1 ABC transporter permease [Caldimicrobium sp.]